MRMAVLVAILALGACVNRGGIRPLRPLEIPLAPYRDAAPTAMTGTLMYEGGCLLFRDEQSRALLLPVWPFGSSFNGTELFHHLPGKSDQVLVLAQEVVLYGQPAGWAALGAPQYQPFQGQCGVYPPFFVSNVRPAD